MSTIKCLPIWQIMVSGKIPIAQFIVMFCLIFLCSCSSKPQKTTWEYMTWSINTKGFSIYSPSNINSQATVDKLSEYGRQGWELCNTIPVTRSDYSFFPSTLKDVQTTEVVLIFKRPMNTY